MARDRSSSDASDGAPDFGALLLTVLDQTTLRLNLRDHEGRFVSFFDNAPEILPVGRDVALGRPSWQTGQYLRADGRERSMLDHPAQEARRTGIAQTGERLGLRFPDGEEHWFLGDFLPVGRGASGYEVLSVLQDTTPIERERREAVQLAAELGRAMVVATAIAAGPRTCEGIIEAIRAPMNALLPACHLAIGRYRAGWETARVLPLNELDGMAPFDRRPRRTADLASLVERAETRVNNDLGPADIVGPRAIGTDLVPARSSVLMPLRGERERSVLAAYSQQPHFFTPARVAALEALMPALAAALEGLEPASEAAA